MIFEVFGTPAFQQNNVHKKILIFSCRNIFSKFEFLSWLVNALEHVEAVENRLVTFYTEMVAIEQKKLWAVYTLEVQNYEYEFFCYATDFSISIFGYLLSNSIVESGAAFIIGTKSI